MKKDLKWLDWAKEIQAIAQAGLAYTKDDFDRERFERLRELSCEIIADYAETDFSKVKELFAGESGYQTPKVDVRAVIFKDHKLLLVQEKADGKWALPGGWADIGFTPKEIAVKETLEETGLKVKAHKLLAVIDKSAITTLLPPSTSISCLLPVKLSEARRKRGWKRKTLVFSHWRICLNYLKQGIRMNRSNTFLESMMQCIATRGGTDNGSVEISDRHFFKTA